MNKPLNRPTTIRDYCRRIERVIAHMGDNLDAALDLDALADVAAFSPCHFHRIYHALTGETVADTLRRLRLHRAAGELIMSTAPLAGIARRAGYGSTAAFTRAFGASYRLPPAAYRQQGRLIPPRPTQSPEETRMYDVTICDLEPVRLATLAHTGSYMGIGPVFERLYPWATGRGLLTAQTRSVGIYHDDPKAKPADELRSEAGLSVGADFKAEGEVRLVTVPGGRHAVLHHKGPYAELEHAYAWLYGTWLPQSGQEAADRPIFEEYLNNPRELPTAEWRTDICLPLLPARG